MSRPLALTIRVMDACNCADGKTLADLRAKLGGLAAVLNTLVSQMKRQGRIFQAGIRLHYRYFATLQQAQAWTSANRGTFAEIVARRNLSPEEQAKAKAKRHNAARRKRRMCAHGSKYAAMRELLPRLAARPEGFSVRELRETFAPQSIHNIKDELNLVKVRDGIHIRYFASQELVDAWLAAKAPPKVSRPARKGSKPAPKAKQAFTVVTKQDRQQRAPRKPAVPAPVSLPTVKAEAQPIYPANVKRTTAPPFVDRRFIPDGPPAPWVSASECRPWAAAYTGSVA